MSAPRLSGSMGRLLPALGLPLALALGQQQALLHRAPHLQRIGAAPTSAGPASLEVRFSRPIPVASLEQASRLEPPLTHRWLGQGDKVLMALAPGQRITRPLLLTLAGRDRRGLALPTSRWRWDPRPRIVAVVPLPSGGDQLRLLEHDGRWRALTPALRQILQLEALGDGSGVAFTSIDGRGRQQAWRLPLHQRNLLPADQPAVPVRAGRLQSLAAGDRVLFHHLSTDRRGSLLVQSGGVSPRDTAVKLWPPGGGRPGSLAVRASGPLLLLPQGGGLVVPESEGLSLLTLPPRPPSRSHLPGRRDLSGFCPLGGRALLVRHWPDYRRSLELVEPGRSPRQLWIGSQAVVGSVCMGGGQRIWMLLLEGLEQPRLTLVELDRTGLRGRARPLDGWELEPGAGLHFDPASGQLLTVLRPRATAAAAPAPAPVAVLIDSGDLTLRPLGRSVRQAVWLPPG